MLGLDRYDPFLMTSGFGVFLCFVCYLSLLSLKLI